MNFNKIILLGIIITIPFYLFANKMEFVIKIEDPIIIEQYFVNDINVLQTLGYPMLPYINKTILLPMGEKVKDITINFSGNEKIIDNIFIKPSRGYYTSSQVIPGSEIYADVYKMDVFTPSERFYKGSTQRLQGHDLIYVTLIPYLYNPIKKQIKWQQKCKIVIETEYDPDIENNQNIMLTNDFETKETIKDIVINPELINSYHKDYDKWEPIKESLVDPNDPYDMIIITKSEWVSIFDEYVDWREGNCNPYLNTTNLQKIGVFTIEDIYTNYTGVDHADKIRNFVIDAYQAYASVGYGLRYLMLGGDFEIIPTRGIRCHSDNTPEEWDYSVECDTYYGGLDGSWDSNGDGIYDAISGNIEIDCNPEVRVGRIPVSNIIELENVLDKTINYCSGSSNHFVFVGDDLQEDHVTGEDFCEQVYEIIEDNCDDLEYTKLYNGESVSETINSGFGFLHHFGHANSYRIMGISNPSILTNSDRGFIISNGCYSAEFSQSDAIGEKFLLAPNGAYAYIGNTSYGWYSWWWTPSGYVAGGPGIHMSKIFAYYSTLAGPDKRGVGLSLNIAKYYAYCDMPSSSEDEDCWLWQIVAMNLLGDPSLMIPSYFINGGDLNSGIIHEDQVLLVYGDLSIPDGNTVIMEPGSQLIFLGHYGLDIQGELLAEGTEEKSIIFTSNQDTGWKGLSFNQTPSGNNSNLKYCSIEYGNSNCYYKDDRYPPDPLCNGGGIFVKDYDNLVIENCTIENNLCGTGDGICLFDSSPIIKNCLIINNGYSNTGAALFLRNSNPNILSCTIYGNWGYLGSIFCTDNSDPTFRNCIFWDHYWKVYLNDTSSDPHFYYCDIEDGLDAIGGYSYSGSFENNIDEDPLILQEGSHIYHLLEGSPCIDAGDPNSQYNDPDETRADMGCYPTVYDIKKIEDSWNWVSFPRLDRECNDPVYAPDVLQNIEPFPTYLELLGQGDVYLEYNEGWDFTGGLSQVQSTSGYKLETSNENNNYLPLYGSRVAPDTPITLYASDYYVRWNWIGYWLPQPQMSDVAFGNEWNTVWSIKAADYYYHDGSMEYKDGISVTYPYSPIPMEYGKGYLVRVHDTVTDFQWNIPNEKIPNPEKLESQYFSYNDEPDYEAINIVDIDENILEIGVFQNDVCVGAAVVDSGNAQILAYTEYVGKDECELSFQVVAGRGDKQQVKSYYVYDFAVAEYIERKLIAGKQEYSIIRLSTDEDIPSPTSVSLSQNVPNPFNHSTTIFYAIPKEALVEISIYNIRGQRVRKLVNEKLPAGEYSSVWNGENENGKYLSNGIYFYKLSTGKKEIIKKLIYMR